MTGNTGHFLRVDLTVDSISLFEPPPNYYTRFVGGSGLAAKLFWENGDFKADALSPESLLIFALGPFAGLRLSGASRFSAAARSPLTGHWADSSCGGNFAPELRFAGFDGILISGVARVPSILVVTDHSARIESSPELWELGVEAATASLKQRFGRSYKTLVIGPAGENLVKFACIMNDGHDAFGRAGLGAVMGSKRLKAIVLKSSNKDLLVADQAKCRELVTELNNRVKESVTLNVMKENGTAANLEGGVHLGDVPIRNFTSNFWEDMSDALTGSTLSEKYLIRGANCAFCSVACKRIVQIDEGPFAIPKGPGPEYETIAAFGSLLGSMDLAAVCKAGRVCNDLGMDTISCGATIAWVIEASEKGHIGADQSDGLKVKWGDIQTVIDELLPSIAQKRGKLGALLAEGSVAAARRIGRNSNEYTVHSKGLEAPMHDPRGGGHGLALTYSVSHRGACHVSSPMLFMEMGACYYPEIGFDYELEPLSSENKPESAVVAMTLGALENSACMCQFADREITIPEWVQLFNVVAGLDWEIDHMMKAGRRIFYLQRLINYRYGLRAKDDHLSPRLLTPAVDGAPEGIEIDFEKMKTKFYKLMDLDQISGIPSKKTLQDHNLELEADTILGE
ncbi:MAG: aldehyde ferredoxin oxidoreductase family protein [Deltaproteobacteria bacterium]|nr:aldehyde ferredoxin oxidoreductase family protein [Deltaproteobacteria bacterium]